MQRNIQLALEAETFRARAEVAEQEVATMRKQGMQPGLFDSAPDVDARIQAAEARAAAAEAALQQQEQFHDWERRLLGNGKLDPAARLSLRASAALVKHGTTRDVCGPVRVRNEDIEERAGLSRTTSYRVSERLEAAGFVVSTNHDDEHLTLPNGKPLPNRYMQLSDEVWEHPETLSFPNAPKRGGYRLPCAHCGGKKFRIEKQTLERHTCMECGEIYEYAGDVRTRMVDLDQNAPAQDGTGKFQNETQESEAWEAPPFEPEDEAAEGGFLLPAPQNGTESLGFHFGTTATEEKQEPSPIGEQLSELAPMPSLWPIPASWDDAQLERETASYLFVAGWECSAIVEMTRKAHPKYVELKESWSLEVLLQHLRGQRVIALKQTNQEQAYLVIIDFDRPSGVQAAEQACPILIARGLLPLLSYSPVHGAGLSDEKGPRESVHLILAFRDKVQVRAVLALLDRLCPELRQHWDKVWPNFNMRIPGFYHQPDVSGWCTLVSPVTGEKAQHGSEAWRLVLSHQADPVTVPDLPPDEPTPTPEKPKADYGQVLPPVPAWSPSDGPGPQFSIKQLIRWVIETHLHTLDNVLPRTTKTHALAIWRDEKEPSVQYWQKRDGRWWWKDWGTLEEGDVYDLWWHVKRWTKAQANSYWAMQYRAHLQGQARRN
jgi:hypothetical protein